MITGRAIIKIQIYKYLGAATPKKHLISVLWFHPDILHAIRAYDLPFWMKKKRIIG